MVVYNRHGMTFYFRESKVRISKLACNNSNGHAGRKNS